MSIIGGINLGSLTDYLLFFANGSSDANWQGASKGFVGNVAVDGIQAKERTSGFVPYAGTIYTNDATLSAWQNIIDDNAGQASGVTGEVSRISSLEADLISALQQINALSATPGYESRSLSSLNGLNTQNGINEVYVINITSGLSFSDKIEITGDAGDVFILRWDTDGDPTNGYQGQVKPQSGGAIVPLGGLTPANFINVAGDINSSGGGTTPPEPYPQGPRFDNGTGDLIDGGEDFNGGGFFTGYWLTTGKPTIHDTVHNLYYGETSPLSNGIFVGGWYSLTTKFSMTSGTSGVYVSPNEATFPSIDVEKEVSPDGGITWFDADAPTGPDVPSNIVPKFRFIVTNTGNVTLTNVTVSDDVYGLIGSIASFAPGASSVFTINGVWAAVQQVNTATASGTYDGISVSDTDPAYWFGVVAPAPAIDVEKEVSPDNGLTWFDADSPTGPNVVFGFNPLFRFTVTNTGNVPLTNVTVNDNVFGLVIGPMNLALGGTTSVVVPGAWALGQQSNIATASGTFNNITVTDTDPAYWFGVQEPTPGIDVEKEVSPDGGTTWYDADDPTGPNVIFNTSPMFRFTVTNIGSVPLTDVTVTDDVYGPIIGLIPVFAIGASLQTTITRPWLAGQQVNTATAQGFYLGSRVTDTDPAYWFGVEAPVPAIDVEKEVSPDNGITWFDADDPPGPDISADITPRFRITVTNTGPVLLTNVNVTDDVLGFIGFVAQLAPGASAQWIVAGTWAFGLQKNTVTATDDQGVTDTDPAYYTGVANPAIDVEKLISVDGGITWQDADEPPFPTLVAPQVPMYQFILTNTGNVPLSLVSLTDTDFGLILLGGNLAVGQSITIEKTGTFATGEHCNTATATGAYVVDDQTFGVEDEDSACYNGVEQLSIDIEKLVSVDNGLTWVDADTPPGPLLPEGIVPQFKFIVTNTSSVTLTDITVTDSNFGIIAVIPSLAPGGTYEQIIF